MLCSMQLPTEQQLERIVGEGLWVSVQEMLLGLGMWRRKFFFISSMLGGVSERGRVGRPSLYKLPVCWTDSLPWHPEDGKGYPG